jgi:hypothetical protein
MAPLSPNTTKRWYVDYAFDGGQHTMQFRTMSVSTDTEYAAEIRAFLLIMAPAFDTTWHTIQLRKSESGSSLSFPFPMAAVNGEYGTALAQDLYPRFFSFVGRGQTGRRVRITVFGFHSPVTQNYRVTSAEQAGLHAALDYLQDPARGFVTIGGDKPIWNEYVNSGYNAYFQRKLRRAG